MENGKKTVIIGASPKGTRYSYIAAHRLKARDIPFVPVGLSSGSVFGHNILNIKEKPQIEAVDTVTMYINPSHQAEWQDYILSLNPRRIIFNPGTENPRFAKMAENQGIQTIDVCTLVMLSVGDY